MDDVSGKLILASLFTDLTFSLRWITLIMSATFTTIGWLVIPETFEPVLLRQKAARLRFETKDWALHSKSEESPLNLKAILTKYLLRPLHMFVKEPIVCLFRIP